MCRAYSFRHPNYYYRPLQQCCGVSDSEIIVDWVVFASVCKSGKCPTDLHNKLGIHVHERGTVRLLQ